MGSEKDHLSDDVGDADLPSDFFDDFSKDDFMNGLSVIDSWNDEDNSRRRIDTETLDSVKDLRELIGDGRVEEKIPQPKVSYNSKYKWEKGNLPARRSRSAERLNLDDFIKPGSRRDPNKTSEAIKKDKEEKVKEYLAKRLELSDNIQPPGTELDDYFTENKSAVKNKSLNVTKETTPQELLPNKYKRSTRESPGRPQQGPHRNSRHSPRSSRPRHSPQNSPRYSRHHSPLRSPQNSPRGGRHRSPNRSPQHSPRSSHHRSPRRSPQHSTRQSPSLHRKLNRSPHRNFRHDSPQRKYKRPMQRSPRRYSPQRRSPRRHSPLPQRPRRQSSRSPRRLYTFHHSPKSQPRDNFLYPAAETPGFPPMANYQGHPGQPYPGDFSGVIPGYAYPQGAQYAGYSGPGYDYGMQPEASVIPLPQPVPPPVVEPSVAPGLNILLAPGQTPVPEMVPPPSQLMSPATVAKQKDSTRPYDALAQLVADGKLSKEDYLKLAPNKGMSNSVDPKARILMLNRCNHAVVKLNKLLLPNRLLMNSNVVGKEPKCLENKFCSPLKRQPNVEFQFTKSSISSIHQNKQLVDSIIATVGLDKVVARTKKKIPRNMRDAACQTVRPHCDVCEVRESTKVVEAGTSTEPDYFSSSVHTQVVEHDLMNSKSVFNPTGSAPAGATMSIAHLTPAQLVSQLAARAKTLKQTSDPEPPSNQYGRYNQPNNYDNRGQYNYNYRY